MPNITTRTISSARPKSAPFFIRDTKLQGFAVKVNPSGSKKYIAEVWNQGKSRRKTLGSFPDMKVSEARDEAITFINSVKSGRSILVPIKKEPESENSTMLETLFNSYIHGGRLKNSTINNYRHVIFYYLKDWIKKPVSGISVDGAVLCLQ